MLEQIISTVLTFWLACAILIMALVFIGWYKIEEYNHKNQFNEREEDKPERSTMHP